MNILLCVTGSVAATVFPKVRQELLQYGEVKTVLTESAGKIYKQAVGDYRSIPNLYTDEDEWKWNKIGDPILHIDLQKWADVLVIAPLCANTLAKIANGMSDNLVTSIVRAWPDLRHPMRKGKPLYGLKNIIVAPAMNTNMWQQDITIEHLESFRKHHMVYTATPIEKTLACGDTGVGAMAHASVIGDEVKRILDFKNKQLVQEIIK